MQTKLPRELRDIMYEHIHQSMDAADFWNIARAMSPTTLRGFQVAFDRHLSLSMQPGNKFAQGFTNLLISKHHDLAVLDMETIGQYLNKDFFDLGVVLSKCTLSKLIVYGPIDDASRSLSS
jgi:hypothetical protein